MMGNDYFYNCQHRAVALAMSPITFSDILEAADQLTLHDQEELVRILEHRLREQKRTALVKHVQDAQQEFAQGNCQPITPVELMKEILA
jgi:hypothetical protein